MAARWLTPQEREAWVRLVALIELLPSTFDAELRGKANLVYFEYYVLAILSEAENRTLRMSTLAAMVNSTLPRLSHAVRRLEQRGLVERTPCEQDGRSTNVHLTEQGWQLVKEAAPDHVDHVRRTIFDVLSPEQVNQLSDISAALLGALPQTQGNPESVGAQALANTATRNPSPSR
ncbi:MarR family winged helix-turn-helix transcriptional regulator [Propionibacteriaceae bacterium Y1923]